MRSLGNRAARESSAASASRRRVDVIDGAPMTAATTGDVEGTGVMLFARLAIGEACLRLFPGGTARVRISCRAERDRADSSRARGGGALPEVARDGADRAARRC